MFTPLLAELTGANVVDQLIQKFHAASSSWSGTLLGAGTGIFWTLALISLFMSLAFAAAACLEFGNLVFALIRWIVFTGIAWWAYQGGPQFSQLIINSFRQLGGQASGMGQDLSPTLFLDASFKIYQQILNHQHWWDLGPSIGAELVGILIVACCAWMTYNVIMALCSAWFASNAGVIFLALGASPLGSDAAINYWRVIIAVGAKLMTMELVMGIGYTFIQGALTDLSVEGNGGELVVYLACALVLALLSHSLPNLIASIICHGAYGTGGNVGMVASLGLVSYLASKLSSASSPKSSSGSGGSGAQKSSVERASDHGDALIAQGYGNRKRSGGNGNGTSTNGGGGSRP